MAFIRSPEEEERLRQEREAALLGNGSDAVSPGGTTPSKSPGAPGGAATVDVNAYLRANKPQVEQLGENVAKNYENEQAALSGDVSKAESDALNQISTGRIDYDKGFVDRALADPTRFVTNPGDVERFTKTRDASYTGPSSIAGYDELAGRVNTAKSKSDLIDTEGGRKELIRSIAPQTTAGGRDLDAMLLAQTPEAIARVKGAAGKISDVEGNLTKARDHVTSEATAAQNSTDMARENLRNALTSKVGAVNTDLDTRVSGARATAGQRSKAVQDFLSGGSWSGTGKNLAGPAGPYSAEDARRIAADLDLSSSNDPEADLNALVELLAERQLASSGYNPPVNQPVAGKVDPYNANLADYLTVRSPDTEITRGNVATADDYANSAALAQLSGDVASPILNRDEAALAGTANLDLNDFSIPTDIRELLRMRAQQINRARQTEFNRPGGGGTSGRTIPGVVGAL